MKRIQVILFILILLIAVFTRFYRLGEIPMGIHADEASQGYNAYSLLKTGKDMYGKLFPILFRANGSYQPPVYTYLTIVPIFLFGNTVSSVRFVSALAGLLLVGVTFLFVYLFGIGKKEDKITQALIASVVLAISPWSIHFSRLAIEGNLVVVFFVLGLLLALLSLKKKWFFVFACLVFAFTTHVYYTERITSILFMAVFVLFNRKIFLKQKKEVLIGLVVFVLVMIPHLVISESGALTKRLSEVGYIKDINNVDGGLINKTTFLTGKFADHYFSYFSPKNLFFDPGQDLGRTSQDLAVFYPWFFIFALAGVRYLLQYNSETMTKLLALVIVIGPLPASITGDPFYPLRVLTYLWGITLVVSYGFNYFWNWFGLKRIRMLTVSLILFYSILHFYISYFATSKYASSPDLSYSYIKLVDELSKYKDKKVFIDFSGRAWGVGIRLAYLLKADPTKTQDNLSSQLGTPYYSGDVNAWETFRIDNITIEPINWLEICGGDVIVVGDRYSISENQIKDHKMKLEFVVKNAVYEDVLFGYLASGKCSEPQNR